MFDLNEAIARWRTRLAQSDKCSRSDIDELEAHLRDEVEQLTAASLSQEEAFLLARRRLGDTESLEGEFAKVNGGYFLRRRLAWMAAGALAFMLARFLGAATSNAGILLAIRAGSGVLSAVVIGIATGALGFGVALLLTFLVCRRGASAFKFDRLTAGLWGKIVVLVSGVLAVLVLSGATVLSSALMARTMPVEEFGRIAEIAAYLRLTMLVLMPVVMMVLLLNLGPSRKADIECNC